MFLAMHAGPAEQAFRMTFNNMFGDEVDWDQCMCQPGGGWVSFPGTGRFSDYLCRDKGRMHYLSLPLEC